MRRSIYAVFLFVLGLVTLLPGSACRPPTSSAAIYHEASAADLREKTVALVTVDDEGQPRPFCSGVWVTLGTILTAKHCLDDALVGDAELYVTRADLYPDGPKRSPMIVPRSSLVLAIDPDHDLALLYTTTPPKGHGVARRVEARKVAEQEARGVADAPVGVDHAGQDLVVNVEVARVVGGGHPQAHDFRAQLLGHALRVDRVAQ
jgi:hypothetical protein